MGFLDELKKMTRPYDDDDEFFDDEDEAIPVAEEPAPARPAHHLLEWEYVFFLPRDILKDGLLQKSSLLL